ncbi:MAG: nitrilase [Desulfobacteraceae bacterium]|nr:MAG: nitrilase [Desulfobacteraceae bacterium]
MKNIRIAAVVCRSPVGDIEHNLTRTEFWAGQAHNAGADVVCFPELNITGYYNHAETSALAQLVPGPATERISELSRSSRLIILAGLVEHNPQPPGRPFATHCVFWPDGRVDRYRKLHLAPNESAFFSAGADIPVFCAQQANFGIQLCYDAHFPELSTAMAAKQAHILFMPHASPRGDAAAKHLSWMRHLPARAFDNGLFVVACNQWGENGKGLVFPGNAMVVAPSGNILAKRVVDNEGMLVVDLSAADLQTVRTHPMRYFFPNRRPELYRG